MCSHSLFFTDHVRTFPWILIQLLLLLLFTSAAFAGSCDSTLQWMLGERGPTQVSSTDINPMENNLCSHTMTDECYETPQKRTASVAFQMTPNDLKKLQITLYARMYL